MPVILLEDRLSSWYAMSIPTLSQMKHERFELQTTLDGQSTIKTLKIHGEKF